MISTGFIIFDILLILVAALLAILVYFKYSYQYWKTKGVPYLEPSFPYGNNVYLFPKSSTFGGEAKVWYDKLKADGHKFGGVWAFSRKVLVLVDPNYIKDILSQDFQYFINRDVYSNEKNDPLGTHLFNIKQPSWKPLRQKLTPNFTTGKMRMMFKIILDCSNFMIDYMEKCVKMGDDIQIREVLTCFTTDVIGSVAFGINCNSFDNTHAEFLRQGKKIFEPTPRVLTRMLMSKHFPDLSRKLGICAGPQGPKDFFANMVKQTMEYRSENNIVRPDMLQVLINMNKETKNGEKPFEFEQVVANSIIFFIAGFDTSSTAMTFTLYELARNPDIQEKVRTEINKVIENHKGEITYDAVKEMTYLTQVLHEAMRLYPSLSTLSRICTKDYQLRDTKIIIEKGTSVVISTLGLGRDPEHFPNPEKFDPERFSPEETAKRHPYVHLPFGEGPRNCIGLRFGEMQSKIGLIRILTNFRLKISPKTKMPLTLDYRRLLLKEKETLYLHAEKI